MNEIAPSVSDVDSVPAKKKRRFWQMHRSTFLIVLAVCTVLTLMMVPGQQAHYWGKTKGFSGSELEVRAKFRFHGWPAIHMVSFENYGLFESDLTEIGRKIKSGSMPASMAPAMGGQKLPKGDKTNQELALRKVDEAYDEYQLNDHFWAERPEIVTGEDSFLRTEPTSRYPIWMEPTEWTLGMKRKFQWQGLAINLSLALAILMLVMAVAEFRRRRRSSFWQISLLEIGALSTVACLGAWFYSGKRHAEEFVTDLRSRGVVTQAYMVAEPVWLTKIVGPAWCTKYGNLMLDMSKVSKSDRDQLRYLRYTSPWMLHLESFGEKDTGVVAHVPGTGILWLDLTKSYDRIEWGKVSFGPKLEHLMVESFDEDDKSSAVFERRMGDDSVQSKLEAMGVSVSGPPKKDPSSFVYPPISFDPFEVAAAKSSNVYQLTVSGFEIDREFIQRFAQCGKYRQLHLGVCHVTEGAVEELMTLPILEHLSAEFTSNLSKEQIDRLYSRHKGLRMSEEMSEQ